MPGGSSAEDRGIDRELVEVGVYGVAGCVGALILAVGAHLPWPPLLVIVAALLYALLMLARGLGWITR